jgi:predicted DNA-binding ArsR family transcriptional regulator|tara:strand:- start:660 stop:908 length:249 start_codon:yes stop_codon:yes gene_type:complete
MKEVLVNAVRSHLTGNINKHLANIQVYMNNTIGIGEHSDIVETIELELEQVANYHDKLEMLVKYFTQPSINEEETNDDNGKI